jgi:hypothetical protein
VVFASQQNGRLIDRYFTVEFIVNRSLMAPLRQGQRLFTYVGKFSIHKNKKEKFVNINNISHMMRSIVDIDDISNKGLYAKRDGVR